MVQILGFSVHVRFRGHFEKIGIAKVLLNTKSRRVEKFRGCRFSDVWETVAREKNKLFAKYNGSLAFATLERATIITPHGPLVIPRVVDIWLFSSNTSRISSPLAEVGSQRQTD